MKALEYIYIEFYEEEIEFFQKLVESLCKKDDFYYSDVVHRINGDVKSKLHLTIFYGLIKNHVDINKIKIHLDKTNINKYKQNTTRKNILEKWIHGSI